ncbi:capsule biosynthesis protein CapA, partial [Sinorhizobium medicae]|nr:capsule biosynthesis protein CapA [Sinorhizobium medicae]
ISFHPVVIGGDDGLEDGVLEPRLVPQLVTGDSAVRILGRLQEQSARLGAHIEISGNVGRLQAR